jgi:phosphoribosylamine-glycine ligase
MSELQLRNVSVIPLMFCPVYSAMMTSLAAYSDGNVCRTGQEAVARWPDHLVFHSGTAVSATGDLVTAGGRVLVVVAVASELMSGATKATKACANIVFGGAQYRTDIAHKGIAR